MLRDRLQHSITHPASSPPAPATVTACIPLDASGQQLADQFCQTHSDLTKAEQVYCNTLAIWAVHQYLQAHNISTDLTLGDAWNPVMQVCMDVADLVLWDGVTLECRPVFRGVKTVDIPMEVMADRAGYVVVQLDDALEQATLLGFIKQTEVSQVAIATLTPITDLLPYLHHLNSLSDALRLSPNTSYADASDALRLSPNTSYVDSSSDALRLSPNTSYADASDALRLSPNTSYADASDALRLSPNTSYADAPPEKAENPIQNPKSKIQNPKSPNSPTLLTAWLSQSIHQTWSTLDTLLGSQAPVLAYRTDGDFKTDMTGDMDTDHGTDHGTDHEPMVRVTRGKVLPFDPNGIDDPIALLVEIMPKEGDELNIWVKLCPQGDREYLPTDLKLGILDETGTEILAALSRGTKVIELNFSGESGDRFDVKVGLGDYSVVESFVV